MFKSVVKKIMGASAALVLGAGLFAGCSALTDGVSGFDSEADGARVALRSSDSNGVYNVIYLPDMDKLEKLSNIGDYTHICLYSVKLNKSGKLAVTSSFSVKKEDGSSTDVRAFTKRYPADRLSKFINKVKSNYPKVKVVACLGGGDDEIVDSDTQKVLIYNYLKDKGADSLASQLATMVKDYNLDGVDLDWEYFSSFSKYNKYYKELAKSLRSKLPASKGYSLSVAFPVASDFVDSEVVEMCNYLDVVSVMSYKAKHWDTIKSYYQKKLPASKLTYGISYEKKNKDDSKNTTIAFDESTTKKLVNKILDAGYKGIMAWDYKGDATLRNATCSAIKNYKASSSTPTPTPTPDPVNPGSALTVKFSSSTKILSKSASNFGNSTTGSVIVSNGTAKVENGRLKLTEFDASKPIDVYVRFTDAPANGKVKVNTASSTRSIKITGLDEVDTEGDTRKSLFSSSKTLNTPQDGYDSSYTVSADVSLKKTYGWVHIQYKYASGKSASSSHTLYVDNVKIQ